MVEYMENKIKVTAVRVRTARVHKSVATADNDVYPYFADETVTYKVYLSEDISGDMERAIEAVKDIVDKVETTTLKLTPEGPNVDLDDSRRFSKDMSERAVELLSAALPQYEFEVAQYTTDLKYELKPDVDLLAGRDVVADRHTVMKFLLGAAVVGTIIPYFSAPWLSFSVSFIYAMFTACILYCLLTWIVARMVKADKISVSIGVTPRLCLYRLKTVDIFCGPVPFPDIAMPASVMSMYNKSWTIASIPPIIMTLIGYAFVYYRNYLFDASPDAAAHALLCPAYSMVALLAVSCFLTAAVALVLYLEKAKDIYPQQAWLFAIMEWAIVFTSVIAVYNNFAEILAFIGS